MKTGKGMIQLCCLIVPGNEPGAEVCDATMLENSYAAGTMIKINTE